MLTNFIKTDAVIKNTDKIIDSNEKLLSTSEILLTRGFKLDYFSTFPKSSLIFKAKIEKKLYQNITGQKYGK